MDHLIDRRTFEGVLVARYGIATRDPSNSITSEHRNICEAFAKDVFNNLNIMSVATARGAVPRCDQARIIPYL